MAPLACITHWYISLMYVVPVLGVGAWGWWSSRRMARRRQASKPAASAASAEAAPAAR